MAPAFQFRTDRATTARFTGPSQVLDAHFLDVPVGLPPPAGSIGGALGVLDLGNDDSTPLERPLRRLELRLALRVGNPDDLLLLGLRVRAAGTGLHLATPVLRVSGPRVIGAIGRRLLREEV